MSNKQRMRRKFGLRASVTAIMLAAGALLGAATASPAMAQDTPESPRVSASAFKPGKWRVLGDAIDPTRPSLAALMLVEAETEVIFCKVKERDNTWRSNLVDCGERPASTNRMDYAASPGIMLPGVKNFFTRTFYYNLRPTKHDRSLTDVLRAAQQRVAERAQAKQAEQQMLFGQQIAPATEPEQEIPALADYQAPYQASPIQGSELPPVAEYEQHASYEPAPSAIQEIELPPSASAQDTPFTQTRFERVNAQGVADWYTRKIAPDGKTLYDVQDRTNIMFRVFTKKDGTEGYSANLRGVTLESLQPYSGVAPQAPQTRLAQTSSTSVSYSVQSMPFSAITPNAQGRFERVNAQGVADWYTRMLGPDARAYYDVQDKTNVIFRVFAKKDGTEGYSTNLLGVTLEDLQPYPQSNTQQTADAPRQSLAESMAAFMKEYEQEVLSAAQEHAQIEDSAAIMPEAAVEAELPPVASYEEVLPSQENLVQIYEEASVQAAPTAASAGSISSTPDEFGRYERTNAKGVLSSYTRKVSPDGKGYYDVQDGTDKVYRVFTKKDGTEGYSTNLRGVSPESLLPYGTVVQAQVTDAQDIANNGLNTAVSKAETALTNTAASVASTASEVVNAPLADTLSKAFSGIVSSPLNPVAMPAKALSSIDAPKPKRVISGLRNGISGLFSKRNKVSDEELATTAAASNDIPKSELVPSSASFKHVLNPR